MAKGLDIDHLAKLARLNLTAEEKVLYSNQLTHVLTYFETLAKADLPAVSDVAMVVTEKALRSDEPGVSLGSDAVTKIAPASHDGQISVPRVVDDES
ncbi:MAG: Asp-tRNA(Asn)/Glu-tRNA(Gln) amidotransferase subunit GatC [Opitutales bacterium]|nr:Asp-tRNA(Asn)/Glu-tRNA(Gln) amidotransferase subunit GatC [Opitutales bacterium]